jgi:polyisoprenoid-binding protein YceI
MAREVKASPGIALAVALLAAALLVGCARPVERAGGTSAAVPAGETGPRPGAPAPAPPDAARYRIDPERSLLTIRVWRGGALAAAGHNHVIASRHLQGRVDRAQPLEKSSVSLRVPVALLTIDEPALRALAGADFAADVPDSARDGTRRNLLGAALLDGERFPGIVLESIQVVPAPAGARITMRATVRATASTFEVPVTFESQGADLVASGEIELKQSQLGLIPFSVMLGALQVLDTMQLQFRIVASR